MRTILLPTDFSENAKNAISYAVNLFGENAKYILFHSYFVNFKKSTMFVSIEDTLKSEAVEELKKEKNHFLKIFANKKLNIETHVTGGELAEEIDIYCEDNAIDYLVMGTKGASGIKEVLIGSNAANLLGKVKCPMITVPENAIFEKPQSFVFAADYEHINKKIALSPLLRLADENHAKILIVHAPEEEMDHDAEAERLNLSAYFLDSDISFHSVDGSNGVDEAINSFAEDQNADLLVMLARGGGFFHQLFHPSVTKKVAFHSKIPVLVLHDEK